MDNQLTSKETALKNILLSCESVAVAFSGGVDSTLLLDTAFEVLGDKAVAFTAKMQSLPMRELEAASNYCNEKGVRHLVLEFDVFSIPGFENNPEDRCYRCKRTLLTGLLAQTEAQNLAVLVEGSNLDDENDYRPGSKAIIELGVASPLKEAGFTKADIRALSKERGLSTWDKPACACLATRLPFGAQLTTELLARIDAAENYLLQAGAKQVRVRVNSDLVRLELDDESVSGFSEPEQYQVIMDKLIELGFSFSRLDVESYRTGSMNTSA